MDRSNRCSGPVTRRSFLEAGALTLGGLTLPDLLRLRAAQGSTGGSSDTSVILLWLQGGPSHMETYDMKPDAPSEYRGIFNPIRTNVPGMRVCELLPMHAKVADKFTIIRSIAHGYPNHAGGAGRFLSGREPKNATARQAQYPTIGPIVSKMRGMEPNGLPPYVSSTKRVFGGGSAYLGPAYLPFVVRGNPNDPDFRVRNLSLRNGFADRIDDRTELLNGLDNLRREVDQAGMMDAMDQYNQNAMELLTSPQARRAFDISQEDPKLRERYGRHTWGQRALLARRLVEAGCSFVTMQMRNPRAKGATGNWDSHAVNCDIFDDTRARLPVFDRAVSALIEDLYQRGLDKKVLLVVAGEFGRTPKINPVQGRPGRDHWPGSMSVLVSGGGMNHGQVIGSTNSLGEHPKDRPLDPNDLLATMYQFLGINPKHIRFRDNSGRPLAALPSGEPIAELT